MAKPSKLLHSIIFYLHFFNWPQFLFNLMDTLISFYYKLRGLESHTVDLDDQTTLHFWISNNRRSDKPNLVLIHGYGGDARWQFIYQIGLLSRKFNVFLPDLLFFGRSYSLRSDRSAAFQAECLAEGLRRLGVGRYSVYSISYGGYVAYRMAEICPEEVERLVIVSSGVGWDNDDEILDQIRKVGRDPTEVLLPTNPQDLRLLVGLSTCKGNPLRFLPDFFLQQFINVSIIFKH